MQLLQNNCENIAKEFLLSRADQIGKEYLENLRLLNLSDRTLESNYKVIIKRIPIQKTFQVKSYVISVKNRTQVINESFVDCEKAKYTVKRMARTFIKMFLFTLDHKNELV